MGRKHNEEQNAVTARPRMENSSEALYLKGEEKLAMGKEGEEDLSGNSKCKCSRVYGKVACSRNCRYQQFKMTVAQVLK